MNSSCWRLYLTAPIFPSDATVQTKAAATDPSSGNCCSKPAACPARMSHPGAGQNGGHDDQRIVFAHARKADRHGLRGPAAQPTGDGRSRSRGRRDRRDRSGGREGKDTPDEQTSVPSEDDSPPPVSEAEPGVESAAAAAPEPKPVAEAAVPAESTPQDEPAPREATPTRMAGRSRRAPKPKQGPTIVPGPVDPVEAPTHDAVDDQ